MKKTYIVSAIAVLFMSVPASAQWKVLGWKKTVNGSKPYGPECPHNKCHHKSKNKGKVAKKPKPAPAPKDVVSCHLEQDKVSVLVNEKQEIKGSFAAIPFGAKFDANAFVVQSSLNGDVQSLLDNINKENDGEKVAADIVTGTLTLKIDCGASDDATKFDAKINSTADVRKNAGYKVSGHGDPKNPVDVNDHNKLLATARGYGACAAFEDALKASGYVGIKVVCNVGAPVLGKGTSARFVNVTPSLDVSFPKEGKKPQSISAYKLSVSGFSFDDAEFNGSKPVVLSAAVYQQFTDIVFRKAQLKCDNKYAADKFEAPLSGAISEVLSGKKVIETPDGKLYVDMP